MRERSAAPGRKEAAPATASAVGAGGGGAAWAVSLQQRLGNQAAARALLQRLTTPKPATPKPLSKSVSALEKAGRDDDGGTATTESASLYGSNAAFFVDFLLYKLAKHANEPEKRDLYLHASPWPATKEAFKLACIRRDSITVPFLVSVLFTLSSAERVTIAQQSNAAFFVRHVLNAAREDRQAIQLLQDHALTQYLEQNAPAEFAQLVEQTPQLRVVDFVRETSPATPTPTETVDGVFDAIIHNYGIQIGYTGTEITPVEHVLTGQTKASRAHREGQKKTIAKLPPIPTTDCHHLLLTFENIVKTYPGLNVTFERTTLSTAVMTRPMSQVPGGLIAKDFSGNVLDDAGAPTGRIFFTGEDGINSHSWTKINGKEYDILFGTTGAQVGTTVEGEFLKTRQPGIYKEKGGTRYLKTETGVKPAANAYSFNTAYRLVDSASKLGVPASEL